jgi:hypothetical protein
VARQGFDGFTIESNGVHTTLIADLDQAAVYGALNRLQPLDLDLIEVTWTGPGACVTESAGHIRAALARRYGPAVVLLEHHLAPEFAEGAQTLDVVRFGADGSPHWSRIWPTPQEHPRHAGLELSMAVHGYQIVSRPAGWSGYG